jgi:hypothetical protein
MRPVRRMVTHRVHRYRRRSAGAPGEVLPRGRRHRAPQPPRRYAVRGPAITHRGYANGVADLQRAFCPALPLVRSKCSRAEGPFCSGE